MSLHGYVGEIHEPWERGIAMDELEEEQKFLSCFLELNDRKTTIVFEYHRPINPFKHSFEDLGSSGEVELSEREVQAIDRTKDDV